MKKVYAILEEHIYTDADGHADLANNKSVLLTRTVYESREAALEKAKPYFEKRVNDETEKFTEFFKADPKGYIKSFEPDTDDEEFAVTVETPLKIGSETWIYYAYELYIK